MARSGRGKTFFFKAFGRNEAEFLSLIRMPEAFIIKRWDAELQGLTEKWHDAYTALSGQERVFVDEVVDTNTFDASVWENQTTAIRKVLEYYTIGHEDISLTDPASKIQKIRSFEQSCPSEITEECRILLTET